MWEVDGGREFLKVPLWEVEGGREFPKVPLWEVVIRGETLCGRRMWERIHIVYEVVSRGKTSQVQLCGRWSVGEIP